MKKIFGFGRKKKGQPPPPGGGDAAAASPCPGGAYELRQKELGKLHRAAASGDLAQVRQGLRKHGIDQRDKAQRTPLHLACANGHVDVVTYLVENKCKLNLFDSDNRSPLMKAVQCQKEKCVAILLEHGADPNLADASGNTALHLAAAAPNASLAGMLLEHNAHIDAQNKEGYTPLILAVLEHHEEMVEFLLKKGADVHARDQCERTPLMTAASGGELNLIKVLLRYGADLSHKDTKGWTAEDYAIIHGYSSLSKQLAEYPDWENTGEASAGGKQSIPVLTTPHRAGAAGFTLGAPAVDRGAIDDFSQGDSISSEKEGNDDSWHTSEEEELDFTPKKPQKPNLTLLMNASQQFKKNNDDDGSRIESPKSQKKNLKHRTPSDANLNKGKCGELLNQDVSDASNLEEEELDEEEEEEEEEEEDENDDGDDDEEYEEEEEGDLIQDEKEEEDLEDEETQSNSIMEEEQGREIEPKGKVNQELGCFRSAKYEGETQCGTGNVFGDDQKIRKELHEKMEGSVDAPVSFIAGCYERLQENITMISPKVMNNELSYESTPKQAVLQNVNNLQTRQETLNKKSVIQEKLHQKGNFSSVDSETTDWKKEIPQPLSDSCGLMEKKSAFGDGFKSINGSQSAAENTRLESQRPKSDIFEYVGEEDAEEEYEEVDKKVCEALKQESENMHLIRGEENTRAVFSSSTKEELLKWEKEEKEDACGELQTAAIEDVKNSVHSNTHQDHNASEDTAGEKSALPALGAEQEEEAESPWDSEIIQTDSDSLRKVSPGVLLPAADEHGACLQSVSVERNNGFSEKPSNLQLKISASVLEMNETSPRRGRQKSDLLEEFSLGDAEDIEE